MKTQIDFIARIATTIATILFAAAIFSIVIFLGSFDKLFIDLISTILLVTLLLFLPDIKEIIKMIWQKSN